ncbi:hypothetical protein Tco_1411388 [Tanacetum coccineum]
MWNNSRRVNHKNFTNKMTHPYPKRSFVPQEVLTRSRKLSTAGVAVNTVRPVNTANTKAVNTVRSVNTAASKPIVNHPKKTNAFKRGYSQSSRPFNRHFVNRNSIINTNDNTTRVKDTTVRDRAVVSEIKGKRANAIKASTCWVWKAKNSSASTTFKKYSYIDVGDEVVHKELGDRMERVVTIASSFEVEQDSDAQTRFETTSEQFNDPPLLKVNTFGSEEDSMKLMELMAHCIKLCEFVRKKNREKCTTEDGVYAITATIDGRDKIITKASIRRHLKLQDSEGEAPSSSLLRISSSPSLPSHHTSSSTPTTPPSTQHPHEAEEPVTMPHDSPLLGGHTPRSDEGSMQLNELMDLVIKLADRIVVLEKDLQKTKKTYSTALTKLVLKVKKLEKQVKSGKARKRARIVLSEDEDAAEDPSK